MAVIVQDGDRVLRLEAAPVPEELFGSETLQTMLDDMAEALDREADGVALAAPQIGLSYRMFIVRYDRMNDTPEGADVTPQLGVYINPEFVKSSRRRDEVDEGCLSVRGIYGTTLRHERATVRARDFVGTTFERGAGGLLAQAFQHEIDHLDGILFIDHAIEQREAKPRAAVAETPDAPEL